MIVLNDDTLDYRYFENMQVARFASMVQGKAEFDYHICSSEDAQFIQDNPIIVINKQTGNVEFTTSNLDDFLKDKFNVDLANDENFEIINKIKSSNEFQILVGVTVDYRDGEKEYFGYIEVFDYAHKLCDYTDHYDFCSVSTNAAGLIRRIIDNKN